MKAYIVYQDSGFANDKHAMLIREDGACLADHICSHPGFMLGDLWGRRKELQEKHPDLVIETKPYDIEAFKTTHKEIFDKAFIETNQSQQSAGEEK